jgi:hypothetical protein
VASTTAEGGKQARKQSRGGAAELVCHLTSEPEGDGEAARRRPPQGGKDLLQLQPAGEREVRERAVGVEEGDGVMERGGKLLVGGG